MCLTNFIYLDAHLKIHPAVHLILIWVGFLGVCFDVCVEGANFDVCLCGRGVKLPPV